MIQPWAAPPRRSARARSSGPRPGRANEMTGSLADAIVQRVQNLLARAQGGSTPRMGQVQEVRDNGLVTVQVDGKIVTAGMATEEPVRPGEAVWTARTASGETIEIGRASCRER